MSISGIKNLFLMPANMGEKLENLRYDIFFFCLMPPDFKPRESDLFGHSKFFFAAAVLMFGAVTIVFGKRDLLI